MINNLPLPVDVIAILLKHKTLSISELIYHLAIDKDEEAQFKKMLKKMVSHNEIKISADNIVSLIRSSRLCVFKANKDGGGIAADVATKENIIIKKESDHYAIDGDEVMVINDGIDKNGSQLGVITEVIKHKITHLVGRVEQYKDKYYLISNNDHLLHYPVIIIGVNQVLNFGEVYKTRVVSYPMDKQSYFKVEMINTLGEDGDDKVFIEQVLIESNVPLEFSSETLNYVADLADEVSEDDMDGRQDLRQLPFITIDGEDARDFDDAVYCEANPDGSFSLSVAIADVAHYVKHGSALDIDAFDRGTSIYFPRRVIPMLPEKLSNGLCSLNPNVSRLVMVCHMDISADGDMLHYEVANAVIYSHHRLTYDTAQLYIDGVEEAPSDIIPNMSALYLVYKALLKSRAKRGAVEFESSEPYFQFDENGAVEKLVPRSRKEAHKLIEECMLAANVSVANFLNEHNHVTLYRNHDRPSEKKFTALKGYLDSLAIKFDAKQETVITKDYQRLVDSIRKRTDAPIVEQNILRSMQLAEYASDNIGHFGLAYERYLHFTSPIRRYPDLLVHRACKAVLAEKRYSYLRSIADMAEQVCLCERRAENLSRKVDSYYKCRFAQKHVHDEFEGVITSVVSFGIFVTIPSLMIDGLVHVTELGSDYFIFDEVHHALIGKSSGFKYSIGDIIKVAIANVDMDKLFIDLELANTYK
ncbi:MAG: ribonuclease R [Burkholderiales bacterium]|nr:ribonuclease R [Burkholderiales bacterium]